jgi:hypothetical protein
MPAHSLALCARWWHLETWLRELAYVELRVLLGCAWRDEVKTLLDQYLREGTPNRQDQDALYTHLATADNDNPLAYLDYSQLTRLINNRCEQFGYALPEKKS